MSSSPRRGSDRKRVVLSAENLEDRTVPSGNVSAFVSGGVLHITGDSDDNRIWVMGLGNGTAIVAPLDNTTINGVQAPRIVGGIAFAYNVQLGDGNDFLYVSNTSGGSSLFVNMGDGNDGLAVDHAKNSGANYLAMGTGNDVVSVGMGKLNGFTTFDLGQGSNRMNVAGTEFGGVAFRGGTQTDSLGLLGVNFRSVPLTSGLDRVYSTLTPVANNDRAAVGQNSSVRVNVAANDTAPGNSINKASIQITRQPRHGTVSVSGDGTVTYSAGNTSETSDSFRYTIRNSSGAISNEGFVSLVLSPNNVPDMTSPIPTITNTGGNSTNLSSIPFRVRFNENVTGFEQADLAVTNGTISNFVKVNDRTYRFNVAPTLDGTVTVSIAAGAAQDAAGNNSVAATRSITSDRTAPTVEIKTTGSPANPALVPVTVTFNEDVTGFVVGDVIVTGGTVSAFTMGNARTYSFIITPNGSGNQITVNVPAGGATDAATNQNTAAPPFATIAARTDAGMTDTLPSANAPEWQTTSSGLKKWIIQSGTGPAVVSTSNLGVFYTGWLLNGTVFDSARTDGAPALFPLANLIPGWKEGLLGMQPGGILRLYVPANLAYGSEGQGNVPPDSDLIFELKLVSLT